MSEEKAKELTTEELQAVRGGLDPRRGGGIKPCPNFSPRYGVITSGDAVGTPLNSGNGWNEYYDCKECNHYCPPEGPCELED